MRIFLLNLNTRNKEKDLAIDANGNVYVTGYGDGDYATIKYIQTTMLPISPKVCITTVRC
jgi:hypothetical protein